MTHFREGAFLATPHPWTAPEKPILNRVKRFVSLCTSKPFFLCHFKYIFLLAFFFVVVVFVFYCCCFAPFSSKILDNNFKKLCNAYGWSYVSFYETLHMSVWSWKSTILVLRNLWMVTYLGLTRSLS